MEYGGVQQSVWRAIMLWESLVPSSVFLEGVGAAAGAYGLAGCLKAFWVLQCAFPNPVGCLQRRQRLQPGALSGPQMCLSVCVDESGYERFLVNMVDFNLEMQLLWSPLR